MFKTALAAALVLLMTAVAPAAARTASQGEFALALAQVLGMEVATAEAAVTSLEAIEVYPDGGWKAAEPMTDGAAEQIESALERAAAGGRLRRAQTDGAMAAAAASVGLSWTPAGGARGRAEVVPWYAPIAGPLIDPAFREGSPFRR